MCDRAPGRVGRLVIVEALPAFGAARMDRLTPQQLHDVAALTAQDPAA